jgi:hypothetical protein
MMSLLMQTVGIKDIKMVGVMVEDMVAILLILHTHRIRDTERIVIRGATTEVSYRV